MKQEEAKAAVECFWPKFLSEKNYSGFLEPLTPCEFAGEFARRYPHYLQFRSTLSARSQIEEWAEDLKRNHNEHFLVRSKSNG
jgi:hypothetical protein